MRLLFNKATRLLVTAVLGMAAVIVGWEQAWGVEIAKRRDGASLSGANPDAITSGDYHPPYNLSL